MDPCLRPRRWCGMKPDLAVDLAGMRLATPLLVASGTYGYGECYGGLVEREALGAIIVKGTSLAPWPGNPPPRIVETPAGMLNAIGLQNPGIDHFLAEQLPRLRAEGTPVIVNVAGRTVQEYGELAARLDGQEGVAGLELNVSCPNVSRGGMAFGTDPAQTAAVVARARAATSLPLLVKLSPNVTSVVEIARAAVAAGADGLSLINTLLGMAIDVDRQRPVLANVMGGLSGPAVMPVALRMVWEVCRAVPVPVLGMGGICSARDALAFILAGARAVAVGTGLFYDPELPSKIIRGIASYMSGRGVESLGQLEGAAWKGDGLDD